MVIRERQKSAQMKKSNVDIIRRFLLFGLLSLLFIKPLGFLRDGTLKRFNQKKIHRNKIKLAAIETINFYQTDAAQLKGPLDMVHRTEIILEEILLDKGFKIYQ